MRRAEVVEASLQDWCLWRCRLAMLVLKRNVHYKDMRSISSRESLAEAIYGFFYSDSIREDHYNLPSMIKSSINDIMASALASFAGYEAELW